MNYYTLDKDRNVVPCSFMEWREILKTKGKHLCCSNINDKEISTVFLGIGHDYFGEDSLFFETIVFDAKGHKIYMRRYLTWQEAEQGHKKAIKWVENGCKDDE